MKTSTVFYHANCNDGITGAYAAYAALGDTAEYIPLKYYQGNVIPPEIINSTLDGRNVYMIDISASIDSISYIKSKAKNFTLLDHHKTAYDNLHNCEGCFFDLNRSGAMIAWEYFHSRETPEFIKYIQDYDLWKFKFPETKYFNRMFGHVRLKIEDMHVLEDNEYLKSFIEKGKILNSYFNRMVSDIAKTASRIRFFGMDCHIVNCTKEFRNDVSSLIYQDSLSAVLAWRCERNEVQVSMRSHDSVDCSRIASYLGGGGHPQACSFTVPSLQEWINILENNKETII